MPPDPDAGLRFDPTDPDDLEQLCAHLLRRSGRVFTVPAPFEWPTDAGDPNSGWMTYPEDPAIRHYDRATRTIIDISFTDGDSFKVFGWVWEVNPRTCRIIDRSGRYHRCGAAELAEGVAAILHKELAAVRKDGE